MQFLPRTEDSWVSLQLKYEKEDHNVCAAPDIETVRKWFRDEYSIHITAMPYITVEGCMWMADVYTFSNEMYDKLPLTTMVCKTYEEAIEKGISKTVNYLKEKENQTLWFNTTHSKWWYDFVALEEDAPMLGNALCKFYAHDDGTAFEGFEWLDIILKID